MERKRALNALCIIFYFTFVIYAIYNNILGNAATVIMEHFGITESRQGLIVTIQSVGGLATGLFLAFCGERFDKIKGVATGMLVMGAACAMFYFSPNNPYLYILVCALLGGIGVNAADIMINGALTEVFADRGTTIVPLGHGIYSVGAMMAPIIVTSLIQPAQTATFSRPYLLVMTGSVISGVALLIVDAKAKKYTPYANMAASRAEAAGNPAEIFKTKKAWIIIAISFLYFSFELGYSTWMPTYAQTVLGMSFAASGRLMTVMFCANLIMRFLAPAVFKRVSIRKAFILFCALAAMSAAGCFIVKNATLAFILMPMASFFSGVASPGLILISSRVFPTRTASASSAVLMSISVSALTLPYLMGLIAEKVGFQVSIFTIVITLALSVVVMALFKDQSPVVPEPKKEKTK